MTTKNINSLLLSIPKLTGVGCLAVATRKDLEKPATCKKSEQREKLSTTTSGTPKPARRPGVPFKRPMRRSRITLKCEFYTAAHDPNAPIHEYTNRVTNLATRLKSIGITLLDNDIIDVLIINLHPRWASIASSLSTSQMLKAY
ncbi:hypothetical protein FKP32DRAFT_1600228 [Trametes sanguinea]|nr:hypothetical protein FKP32DRAFT_1600228 [Trametes sanguinea]